MSFMAGYIMGMTEGGGGGGTSDSEFDRISKLPAIKSFEIADGWTADICTDTDDVVVGYYRSYYGGDGEYTFLMRVLSSNNVRYSRFYKNGVLIIAHQLVNDGKTVYYLANDTKIGDIYEPNGIVENKYIIDHNSEISTFTSPTSLLLPQIVIGVNFIQYRNGEIVTNNQTNYQIYQDSGFRLSPSWSIQDFADFKNAMWKFYNIYNMQE